MATLNALIASGSIAWIALAVLAAEMVLAFAGAFGARPRRYLPFVANALSGAFLILALRSAILGAEAVYIAAWLGLGFLAHIADSYLRLRA